VEADALRSTSNKEVRNEKKARSKAEVEP